MCRFLFLCLTICITTLSHSDSATYKYDTSGKLTTIEYDDGTKITYTYDDQGNLVESKSTKTDPTELSWLPIVLQLVMEE